VSRGAKLLEQMRQNPRDWRIEDVVTLCDAYDIACRPPAKGSHYKVKHGSRPHVLTIPAHRPIKPVYIGVLVALVDEVRREA
jgi:hypothetical protein